MHGRSVIIKERFSKNYRHPHLDSKINESRLAQVGKLPFFALPSLCCNFQEARCLLKARKTGVLCPAIYYVDVHAKRLFMEDLEGQTVKEILHKNPQAITEG